MTGRMVLQDAYDAAQRYLTEHLRGRHEHEIVIASVDEHRSAWIFGYNTRRFVESGDLGASLIGNGPVVVPKDGGALYLARSGSPVEEQLAE